MTTGRARTPRPIAVAATPDGVPAAIRWRGRWVRVAGVEATWEVVAGWWRDGPAAGRRRYYRLRAGAGVWCVVYRDLDRGGWYLDHVLD